MVPRAPIKRRPIYTDLFYRFGAVGLAVILWFFSVSNSQFQADVEFPIEIRNIREGKILREEAPQTAVLRFRGTGRSLAKLFLFKPFSDMKLVLDLERVRQEHIFLLNEYIRANQQRISIPVIGVKENLSFVEVVRPESIRVVLSDYQEKNVPVVPQVTIEPAPGHMLVGDLTVLPGEVAVRGVAEAVANVQQIRTMRNTYTGITAPLDITIGLLHPDLSQVLVVSPVNVRIQADIQPISERRLTDLQVKVINIPEDLNVLVTPSTVALTVVGGTEELAKDDQVLVEVRVDYRTQWSPDSHFVTPQLNLAPGILEVRDMVPRQLEIITTRQLP